MYVNVTRETADMDMDSAERVGEARKGGDRAARRVEVVGPRFQELWRSEIRVPVRQVERSDDI